MSDTGAFFLLLFIIFSLSMAGFTAHKKNTENNFNNISEKRVTFTANKPNTDNNFNNISGKKWECTKMTYPKQEANEMFAPYCAQYTAKEGE